MQPILPAISTSCVRNAGDAAAPTVSAPILDEFADTVDSRSIRSRALVVAMSNSANI